MREEKQFFEQFLFLIALSVCEKGLGHSPSLAVIHEREPLCRVPIPGHGLVGVTVTEGGALTERALVE